MTTAIHISRTSVDGEPWNDALGVCLPVCRGIKRVLNSSAPSPLGVLSPV